MSSKRQDNFKPSLNKDYFTESLSFQELERMLSYLPSNIFLKDTEGKYVFCTQYWHHLNHDDDPDWTIRGKTDYDIRKDKENALLAMAKDREIILTGKGTRYIIENFKDGEPEYMELIKEPVFDKDGNVTGIVGLINDVTESEMLKRHLNKMALVDKMTGLPNRNAMELDMEKFEKAEYPLTVVSIDCDGLKRVNDTYGHSVGDEYIKMTSMIIQMAFANQAKIYRLAGDEFVIIMPKTTEKQAQGLMRAFCSRFDMYKIKDLSLSVTYGMAGTEDSEVDLSRILHKANQDMLCKKFVNKRLNTKDDDY